MPAEDKTFRGSLEFDEVTCTHSIQYKSHYLLSQTVSRSVIELQKCLRV